jgi:2-polyprenyl-3-methyl-5-hydroxy-6-metoxy-1,4-benzoquinol methylase
MIIETPSKTITNNIRTDVCPCCKSRSLSKIGSIKYAKNTTYSSSQIALTEIPELWRCNECQSCFTQNRVSEADSISLYSLGNFWSSDSFEKSKTQATVKLIESLVKPGCKILDVGCANGAMLDYAKQQGAVTFGLEYSRVNLDELRRKQHTAYSDWSQVDDNFDIITAFDVVEHLYNLESFLDCCFSHLSDDGVLLFMTGDPSSWSAKIGRSKWWYVRYPEHILFPSIEYFKSLSIFEFIKNIKTYPYRLDMYSSFLEFTRNIKPTIMSLTARSLFPSQSFPPDHVIYILKKMTNK